MFERVRNYIDYLWNYRRNRGLSFKEAIDLSGLPIISLLVVDKNGKEFKLNFLVDSGADFNVIDKRNIRGGKFKTLGFTQGLTTASSVDENAEYPKIEMDIKYDTLSLPTAFTMMDMENIFDQIKKESGVNVHGIVGVPFLKDNKFIINFDILRIY